MVYFYCTKMSNINVIVTDCDGVLTDGKTWMTQHGEISKGFNTRDVSAIREMISMGYEVYIVTASSWPGTEKWAKKTGATVLYLRDKQKVKDLIGNKAYIAVGDDVWDFGLLKGAYRSFCPSDSLEAIKATKGVTILKTEGGKGVMAELLKHLE